MFKENIENSPEVIAAKQKAELMALIALCFHSLQELNKSEGAEELKKSLQEVVEYYNVTGVKS